MSADMQVNRAYRTSIDDEHSLGRTSMDVFLRDADFFQ